MYKQQFQQENTIIIDRDIAKWKTAPYSVPSGTVDFSKVFFRFSDDWKGFQCFAQFVQGKSAINVLIKDGWCYVPKELKPYRATIQVFGYPDDGSEVVAITGRLEFLVGKGLDEDGVPVIPPTPDAQQDLMRQYSNKLITMLAEAKASGEFNGPQGKQGIQGPQGIPGERGKDASVTDTLGLVLSNGILCITVEG